MISKKYTFTLNGKKQAENALLNTAKEICQSQFGEFDKKHIGFQLVTPDSNNSQTEKSKGEMVSKVFYKDRHIAFHYYKTTDKNIFVEILEVRESLKVKEKDPYDMIFPNYKRADEKSLKELQKLVDKFPADAIESIKKALLVKGLYPEIKKIPF